MVVERLVLKHFRNYTNLELSPAPGVNIITGHNGSGKTNMIEALSLLSELRSFRGVGDGALMQWDADSYFCRADIVGPDERRFEVGCALYDGRARKRYKIDDAEIRGSAEYYGRFVSVILSPGDLALVDGPPEARRRYVDAVIAKIDRGYLRDLVSFRKVLASRNRILKDARGEARAPGDQLPVWNSLFAELTVAIVARRTEFARSFAPVIQDAYGRIADDSLAPALSYAPSTGEAGKQDIVERLEGCLRRDLQMGSTTIGPQRDEFVLHDRRGERFADSASQGQKRTAAIALKIAELDFVERALGKRAVILIDDIFPELDAQRRAAALELFRRENQTFVTMARDGLGGDGMNGAARFRVEDGRVSAL